MKLSNQAVGTLMMALQKCLLEQKDIVPILQKLDFEFDTEEKLSVTNPPTFKIENQVFKPEVSRTTGSD